MYGKYLWLDVKEGTRAHTLTHAQLVLLSGTLYVFMPDFHVPEFMPWFRYLGTRE